MAFLSFTLHFSSWLPRTHTRGTHLHEFVSNEPLAVGAVQMVHAVLLGVALLVQGPEDVLGYLCLLLSSSSTKLVKAEVNHL